jgi:uncharacterized SAM-binding protein YcdF (DUF218 family)
MIVAMTSGQEPLPGSAAGGVVPASERRPRALAALVATAFCGVVVFLGGFAAFLWMLDRLERSPLSSADAIVALTGGQGRVEDALDLLARGYGRRLLITGVNERTSRDAIARLSPTQRSLVECCVDLDYRARNTVQNAAEIGRWAKAQGFSSLIVVTSNYHLPRTLAELGQILPDVAKVPHAVMGGRPGEDWETRVWRGRVILSEYVKFLAVSVRNRVAGWTSTGWQATTARRSPSVVAERRSAG